MKKIKKDKEKKVQNKEKLQEDIISKENINKSKDVNKKTKIVPAYQKKNEPGNKKSNKYKMPLKSKLTIIFLVSAVLLVGLAIFGIITLVNYNKHKPYRIYEESIKTYGFDKVYNNQKADTSDSITKSEAIKMVLSAVFNTSDISGFAEIPEDNYENAMWVEYAKFREIITDSDINKDNANDKATYIEVIRYFANAKVKILDKELNTSPSLNVKDLDKYKSDEQVAIEDMIANEIITINTKKIKGKSNVFKGQVNEIISNFVTKYNTITVDGEKINISEEKMPSNKDEYPYTLASVDKRIYEIENYVSQSDNYGNAKDIFSQKKDYYTQIDERINRYFNVILNVDYNNISKEQFTSKLKGLMLYGVESEKVEEYINYVKNNKIIIKGESKVNFPAVYYDGRTYRVRTTLEFQHVSGNTNKNLFFGDGFNYDIEYDINNTQLIVDVPMGESIDDENLSIFNGSISNWKAGKVNFEM